MRDFFRNISPRNLFVTFLLIAQWHVLYVRLDNDRVKGVVGSDGIGYYDYLLKTFVKRDYPFPLPFFGDQSEMPADSGKVVYPVNKYYYGEALAILPFFLTADFFYARAETRTA